MYVLRVALPTILNPGNNSNIVITPLVMLYANMQRYHGLMGDK